jgi:NitT/TauT family transport system ATP-binding protein
LDLYQIEPALLTQYPDRPPVHPRDVAVAFKANRASFPRFADARTSGGMRQRVALIRVLAIDPKIVLMDEPFAAVDAQTRVIPQEELQRLWMQTLKTVVFVTHSVDEAIYLADRVAVMTARPGFIKAIVPIELPRPRDATSDAFNYYRKQIAQLIKSESRKVFSTVS